MLTRVDQYIKNPGHLTGVEGLRSKILRGEKLDFRELMRHQLGGRIDGIGVGGEFAHDDGLAIGLHIDAPQSVDGLGVVGDVFASDEVGVNVEHSV